MVQDCLALSFFCDQKEYLGRDNSWFSKLQKGKSTEHNAGFETHRDTFRGERYLEEIKMRKTEIKAVLLITSSMVGLIEEVDLRADVCQVSVLAFEKAPHPMVKVYLLQKSNT